MKATMMVMQTVSQALGYKAAAANSRREAQTGHSHRS